MSRFHDTANKIEKDYNVHCEYAEMNKEYIVEGRACESAKEARKVARQVVREFERDENEIY